MIECKQIDHSDQAGASMADSLNILSVGYVALRDPVCDVLFELRNCRLSFATNYPELWAVTGHIDVAILHPTLPASELGEAARLIRSRWPHARILVIRGDEGCLEDALYDDRLLPGPGGELLLSAIEQLTGRRCERELE